MAGVDTHRMRMDAVSVLNLFFDVINDFVLQFTEIHAHPDDTLSRFIFNYHGLYAEISIDVLKTFHHSMSNGDRWPGRIDHSHGNTRTE